jgi:hypothetical protein
MPARPSNNIQPKSVGGRVGKVIQPMIYVPFPNADELLVKGTKRIYEDKPEWGPLVIGPSQIPGRIGRNELLMISIHGHGTAISTTDKMPTSWTESLPQGGSEGWSAKTLATHLDGKVLPENYAGTILMWVCFSAKSWDELHPSLSKTTYINELRRELEFLGHAPIVMGFSGKIRAMEGIKSQHLKKGDLFDREDWEKGIEAAPVTKATSVVIDDPDAYTHKHYGIIWDKRVRVLGEEKHAWIKVRVLEGDLTGQVGYVTKQSLSVSKPTAIPV